MKIISDLDNLRSETLQFYNCNEEELNRTYALGKWNIKQLLVHLSDAEQMLLGRLKRVISEPKQVVWAFDQDLWSAELDYKNYPLYLSKASFLSGREEVIYLTEKYYATHANNQFIHSETGLRTLKDEFDKIAWHNQHHLKQMKTALSGY